MDDWGSLVEDQIRKAMEEERWSTLPGAGKPLKLLLGDDNPHTPDDLKLAYKLLKDNKLAPEWIMLGQELDEKRQQILNNMRQGVNAYQGALADAGRIDDIEKQQARRQQVEATWQTALSSFRRVTEQFNKDVARYNLKAPRGVSQKIYLELEREITRLLG
jgi:hypothetical protein